MMKEYYLVTDKEFQSPDLLYRPIDYLWHEQAAILQPFGGDNIKSGIPAIVIKDKDMLINVALMIIKKVHTNELTYKTLILDWLN